MFNQITLKNYKTHKLTTINLSPITLLIGNNNSGKSNLLTGIQHFSGLVKRGRPGNIDKQLSSRDIRPYRYRLAHESEPMGFAISWNNSNGDISYEINLWEVPITVDSTSTLQQEEMYLGYAICIERISIKLNNQVKKTIINGEDKKTDLIALREKIEGDRFLELVEKKLCRDFFEDFENTFNYHFQPTFLKGLVRDDQNRETDNPENKVRKSDFKIPTDLGSTGCGMLAAIKYIKENEERTFARFTALLRRFEINFQGVRYEDRVHKLLWGFDLGRKETVEEFWEHLSLALSIYTQRNRRSH
jgi:AAA15 family ATPase/GTPase